MERHTKFPSTDILKYAHRYDDNAESVTMVDSRKRPRLFTHFETYLFHLLIKPTAGHNREPVALADWTITYTPAIYLNNAQIQQSRS